MAVTALDMWYCLRFPLKSRMAGSGRIKVPSSPLIQLEGRRKGLGL